MSSFNKVILLGNLTRDPEIRYTPSDGKPVAQFSLAVNKKWKDDNGETKETVSYIDIIVWGKQAENCGQYLHKGDAALIEGELQQRRWVDKETGRNRDKIEVKAHTVTFMPKRSNSAISNPQSEIPPAVGEAFPDAEPVDEDKIPF